MVHRCGLQTHKRNGQQGKDGFAQNRSDSIAEAGQQSRAEHRYSYAACTLTTDRAQRPQRYTRYRAHACAGRR